MNQSENESMKMGTYNCVSPMTETEKEWNVKFKKSMLIYDNMC